MSYFLDSIRYALRQFRLSPVFTVAAVLTLALGIGGTTAIFTLIDAVMLKSLPVGDPSRLYRVGSGDDCCVEGGPQDEWGMFSYPLFQQLSAQMPEFEQVTAFQAATSRLSARREGVETTARPLRTEYVTGNYFTTLGVGAFGGRVLTAGDDAPGAPPVIVLSHHAWTDTYGSDPSIVGSTMMLDGHPFTVAGVAPAGFFGDTLRGDPPQAWIPVQQEPIIAGDSSLLRQPVAAWLRAIGRLRPGASVVGMAPRLTALLRHWMQYDSGYPANWLPDIVRGLPKQTLAVVPASGGVSQMKDDYQHSLNLLLGVCGLVLLIACANVANLLLARSVARRTQTAVRLALGASRRQIVCQALVESVILALVGGLIGLAVAAGASRLLIGLAFRSASFTPLDTTPSALVLGFSFVLSLVTGIVFGAAPAWFATRTAPIEALRGAGRTTSDHSSIARTALLVVQATLSVVLVAGSMMLARSLGHLEHQDFGYQVADRVEVSLNRPPATYSLTQVSSMYRALEDRLRRLPGVRGADLALYNPLTDNWGELILVQGHPAPKMSEEGGASWDRVSANYLQDLGVRIVRGRAFTTADDQHGAPVAIVNEAFVKRFFKSSEDPLGQHFGMDLPENAGTFRIVGIAADAKFAGFALRRPARPMFYVPMAQTVAYAAALMERVEVQSHMAGGLLLVTSLPPGTLEPALRKALADVDSNLTINSVRTMQQQIATTFDEERAVATLAGLFGLVALVLAAIGLYGVTAYSVAQRTNEIGVRVALGADRGRVIALILRSAFARVGVGLLVGLPLAVIAGRLISAQLYGVSSWDPVALATATLSLAVAAFVAAIIPAGRAAALSPTRALRTT